MKPAPIRPIEAKTRSDVRHFSVVSLITVAMVIAAICVAAVALWIWLAQAPGQFRRGVAPVETAGGLAPAQLMPSADEKVSRGDAPTATALSTRGGLTPSDVANGSVVQMTTTDSANGPVERFIAISKPTTLYGALSVLGIAPGHIDALIVAMKTVYSDPNLPVGAHLRLLFAPTTAAGSLVPDRLSIYLRDQTSQRDNHAVSVARTENGEYVLALEPPEVTFSR